jgi:aryl-alcohol dehydrogenase-like predicted oxidoreductase
VDQENDMQYRTLTGTGATVSRLSLGTFFSFGGQLDEDGAIRLVHRALDAGITFFDTADTYGGGVAETILGKALRDHRDGVVVASKVRNAVGPHQHKDVGLTRWHIIRGVEASLRRLGVDCLDICYFHAPDYATPLEESLAAADHLIRQGKILYLGLSNYAAWQIVQARLLCERHHLMPPVVTQVVYSLIARGVEPELLPCCRAFNVGVTIYNPLASGLLTGKHQRGGPTPGTRLQLSEQYQNRYWRPSHLDAVDALVEIARQAGKTPTQLALQWLAARPEIDSIIIGASNLEQLEENLSAWEGALDEESRVACDLVWQRLRGDTFQYNR